MGAVARLDGRCRFAGTLGLMGARLDGRWDVESGRGAGTGAGVGAVVAVLAPVQGSRCWHRFGKHFSGLGSILGLGSISA